MTTKLYVDDLSAVSLSTDYLYAEDSNVTSIIKQYHVNSSSILCIGIKTTDSEKTFKCKMPIFNYNDDGIKYFVNWGDSEEDQEITPYTEAMEIGHEYSAAGEFTIQIFSKINDHCYNPIIRTSEGEFNENTLITSVKMPESLTFLDEETFCKCINLTDVKLSHATTTLAKKAFNKCTSLETIVLPRELTTMFSRVFEGCTKLKSINIYDTNVTTIPYQCFKDCIALKDIGILNGSNTYIYKVQKFDTQCFINSGIEKVVFASPFEIIVGNAAFKNCKSLSGVNFTANSDVPMHLKGSCFYGCTSLTSTIDMGKVALEGESIFCGCTGLTNVVFNELVGIDKIPGLTFKGCTGLTTVDMSKSKSIKTIGSRAFNGCTNLTKVKLPRSLENIELDAFSNCTALVAKFDEEKAAGTIECINIPDNLQYCDWNAFNSTSGHTSISRYFLTGEDGASQYDGYRYQSLKGVIRERICNAIKGLNANSTIGDLLNALRAKNY